MCINRSYFSLYAREKQHYITKKKETNRKTWNIIGKSIEALSNMAKPVSQLSHTLFIMIIDKTSEEPSGYGHSEKLKKLKKFNLFFPKPFFFKVLPCHPIYDWCICHKCFLLTNTGARISCVSSFRGMVDPTFLELVSSATDSPMLKYMFKPHDDTVNIKSKVQISQYFFSW